MTDEILKRLDLLAAKLSTTVDHLWNVLLYQARIEAIGDSIGLLIIVWFPIGVSVVTLTILLFVELSALPTQLFNPQYFALHRILESLK